MPEVRETMGVSSIYQRGTTHIPVEVRNFLKIKDGHRVKWVREDEKIILEPAQETMPRFPSYKTVNG